MIELEIRIHDTEAARISPDHHKKQIRKLLDYIELGFDLDNIIFNIDKGRFDTLIAVAKSDIDFIPGAHEDHLINALKEFKTYMIEGGWLYVNVVIKIDMDYKKTTKHIN